MAQTPVSWPIVGIIDLPHIMSSTTGNLEQLDEKIEYMMPAPKSTLRNNRILRQRAPLACIACRSQHAKCSGESPQCNRCQVEHRHCQYPKSRRKRVALTSPSPVMVDLPHPYMFGPHLEEESVQHLSETFPMSAPVEWPEWSESIAGEAGSSSTDLSPAITAHSCFSKPVPQFIDAYYDYFHKSHSLAPTRNYVNSLVQSNTTIAMPMLYAMQHIGAMYLKATTPDDFKSLALQHTNADVFDAEPRQIYIISATIILTIAAHGLGELTEARKMLDRAISQSACITMDYKDVLMQQEDQQLVDLWKRVYWHLYVLSDQLSSIDFDYDIRNGTLLFPSLDFPLPCDEHVNPSDAVRTTNKQWNLLDYDTSDFDENPNVFSSFTYFVALIRISRSIKRLHRLPPEQLERAATCADARLMHWRASLPPAKQKAVNENGEVDDIMFQAHILSYSLRIDIHNLLSSHPERQLTGMFHAKKALEAAEDALGLLTLYTSPLLISPLSISHISNCTLVCLLSPIHSPSPNTRDYVSFILGSLQQLSLVWTTASQAAKTIRNRARQAYAAQSDSESSSCTALEFPADLAQMHYAWT